MQTALCFEQFQVGDCWRSPARTVTETDVVNFAGLTGDYDPLHVDHEAARATVFGKPIAHGLLGLSLVAGLASNCPRVKTAAFVTVRNWEFLKPIFFGDTVHVVTEVLERRPEGKRTGRVAWKKQLVNQHGETVQSGVFETLVAAAGVVRRHRNAAAEPARSAPVAEGLPAKARR